MAHFLAEQMAAVDSAKTKAEREAVQNRCCELIMRLWAARTDVPGTAKPLGRLEDALQALLDMRADQDRLPFTAAQVTEQGRNPWFTFAVKSYAAEKRMACIAFLAGILEAGFAHEKAWVDEHSECLSDGERGVIEALNAWLKKPFDWLSQDERTTITDLPPQARTQRVLAELESIARRQWEEYELLLKQLGSEKM